MCDPCRDAAKEYFRERHLERKARLARGEDVPRKLKPCGTAAAYYRHIKAGEKPCEPCMEAMRAAGERQRRARGQAVAADRVLMPCGTRAAYTRHRKAGEEPCEPCMEAMRAAGRENAARHRPGFWQIYRIDFANGFSYAGQTRTKLDRRIKKHRDPAPRSKSPVARLIRAGVMFNVIELARCGSQDEADLAEAAAIWAIPAESRLNNKVPLHPAVVAALPAMV